MREATERGSSSGVLGVGLAVVAVQVFAALLLFVDVRLPLALFAAVLAAVVGFERPLWGVALLIAGRLTSTGANAWVRIGRVNLDLFEPALLVCIVALGVRFLSRRTPEERFLGRAPWRAPVLAFLAFQVLGLAWSSNRGEAVQEILATLVLLCTTGVILAFVKTRTQLRTLLWVWLATSSAVALASIVGLLSTSDPELGFEMAQGAREGGFGQHPNWFAMNLAFIVPVAFGLGVVSERRSVGWLAFALGALVFLAQMRSGSRGGTWSLLIGGAVAAVGHPRLRRPALAVLAVSAGVVGTVIYLDVGPTAVSFERIFVTGTVALGQSVRAANWSVCWEMFQDTWGLGIGGGGYTDLLAHYDSWLYDSPYRYPHGIVWGLMAHQGIVGLGLFSLFGWRLLRMTVQLLRQSRDTDEGVLAWAMLAGLIGYAAWSTVEFSYDDKPFWEFLGLYTVLWALVVRDES